MDVMSILFMELTDSGFITILICLHGAGKNIMKRYIMQEVW